MTERTAVFIHTVPPLVEVFARLGAELLPGVRLFHILDEPLLERVRRRGSLAPADSCRLAEHVSVAQEIGASAVLVTCSTISPCVDGARAGATIPILKIDEAMIARAVADSRRIGVVATASTTLEPTRKALEARAAAVGRPVEVELVFVPGAMDALMSDNGATHDHLVRGAVLDLAPRSDVVVLAQASMARVLAAIPETERLAPVLSSPHLALAELGRLLAVEG